MSEQEKVDEWNAKHLPGVSVELTKDHGEVIKTVTETPAHIVGGRAVVWVEGVRGCYKLDRVKAQS